MLHTKQKSNELPVCVVIGLYTCFQPRLHQRKRGTGSRLRRKKRGAATAVATTTTFRKTKMPRPLRLFALAAALLLAAARVDARPGPGPQYGNDERRGYNGVDSRYFSTQQRPPPINDLPIFNPYTPEKAPQVPIKIGERSESLFRQPIKSFFKKLGKSAAKKLIRKTLHTGKMDFLMQTLN